MKLEGTIPKRMITARNPGKPLIWVGTSSVPMTLAYAIGEIAKGEQILPHLGTRLDDKYQARVTLEHCQPNRRPCPPENNQSRPRLDLICPPVSLRHRVKT